MDGPSEAVNVPYRVPQKKLITSLKRSLEHLPTSKPPPEDKNTIGLNLLFLPPEPLVDLIFVHGLWGHYQQSWSATVAPSHFWPKEWLSRDPDFKHVRISSYGYNTKWSDDDFAHDKRDSVASQLGKKLFRQLKESKNICEPCTSPIIMVGHSIGGLMIKEAVLEEQKSENPPRIRALFFFATPHHLASSDELHRRIILACPRPRHSGDTTGESHKMGQMQAINDEFKELQDSLQLCSIHETAHTELGEDSALVLERVNDVLGSPQEKIIASPADHPNIGKFKDPDEASYWNIREALVKTIDKILKDYSFTNKDTIRSLRTYLSITEDTAERDLTNLEEKRITGSCEWLIDSPQFDEWQEGLHPRRRYFWLSGKPGVGKSVMTTAAIRHFEASNRYCSYFFFRQSDEINSTVSALLRSIAFQMARGNAKIREALVELQREDPNLPKDDSRTIWEKVYARCILRANLSQPYYWAIDAVDECSDYEALISFLAKIDPNFPLRVFLTTRSTRNMHDSFLQMIDDDMVTFKQISTEDSSKDIKHFYKSNVRLLPREQLIDDLVRKSDGSFLWANLVLKDLRRADTEEHIQRIIRDVPKGMDRLYGQILRKMSQEEDPSLTRAILTWVVCSIRPLTVTKLTKALDLHLGEKLFDLPRTIDKRCGDLVCVDKSQKVQFVHATVREHLIKHARSTKFAIEKSVGHRELAHTCLSYLLSEDLQPPKYPSRKVDPARYENYQSSFMKYACKRFSNHLVESVSNDLVESETESETRSAAVDELPKELSQFLNMNVLSWIEIVARRGDLSPLVIAAKHFKLYLERCKILVPRMQVEDTVLQEIESWATDLVHLVTRFGKNLLDHPEAIFFLIPPICPRQSSIFKMIGDNSSDLRVKGLSSTSWDERLSCIRYCETSATAVAYGRRRIAVGLMDGKLILYYTTTYQKAWEADHEEEVKQLQFTSSGKLLASSGRREIKIWEAETAQRLRKIPLAHELIRLCFLDDKILQGLTRKGHCLAWELDTAEDPKINEISEPDVHERSHYKHLIVKATFSAEHGILAIAYHGDPIWLWDLERDEWLPGSCWKHLGTTGCVCDINDLVFNPGSAPVALATAYSDGDLVLYDVRSQKVKATRDDVNSQILAVSPDGRILASGSSSCVQLFDFQTLKRIYIMEFSDYPISGLAFSGESNRFVDIRGHQCNIWEPFVLVQSSIATSDEASLSAPVKVVTAASPQEENIITSIACDPDSHYIFCGRANGVVDLYDIEATRVAKEIGTHEVAVNFLSTCSSGVLVSADTSTHVSVRRFRRSSTSDWVIKPSSLSKRMMFPITQIVLNTQGDKLLIITTKTMTVLSIGLGPAREPIEIKLMYPDAFWSQSPSNPNQLVAHEYQSRHYLDWDLREDQKATADRSSNFRSRPKESTRPARPVLLQLADGLLRLKFASSRPRQSHHGHSASGSEMDMRNWIEDDALDLLGANVELVIGLCGAKLLFLDTDMWICSVESENFDKCQYKRHFFIPFHWLSIQSQLVIKVARGGQLVVGKEGEVAVFENGLHFGTLRQLKSS